MKKIKKNNVVTSFKFIYGEKEIEAILFAAAGPLDIETIGSKVSKKINVLIYLISLKLFIKIRN